ncbi:mechanosensitive ion channel family protein [Cognatitamlana onchidii]|uniref:mechanosensitive ion channel family protein n=1 Tax=Cognatitamlana onchidii TaxID=2562860 RepID=UPI0010A6B29D|nr:mechanosensitive ion channel family protein [Algibacter onchidii]
MEIYQTKIIESLIVIAIFVVLRILINQLINKTLIKKVVLKSRSRLIRRSINLINSLICLILLLIIWGVNQSDIAVFVGSVLTIVGVAFFAQWSLLSNITSSIIIFFGHTVKIGDHISIMETKDYEIRGEVVNIGLFFIKIKLIDTLDEITMPNNIFILKTVRKIHSVSEEIKQESISNKASL